MNKQEVIEAFEKLYGRRPTEAELAELMQNQQQNVDELAEKETPATRVAKYDQTYAVTDVPEPETEVAPEEVDKQPEVIVEQPAPQPSGRRSRTSVIGFIIGFVDLLALFTLPFLQIDLPNTDERTIRLYDFLNNSSAYLTTIGIDAHKITILMYILIICPILYMVLQLIRSYIAKAIAMLLALVDFGVIVYAIITVYQELENSILGSLNIDYSEFIGIGFWVVLIMPVIMFVWSLVTLPGKKIR
ncbi:hypothetical protein D3P96_07505 [Weissella viridescens]|uniref:Uncharacterized protein n=1 Tax=Weissella viridescens TaxID=1629 RepID=A0A3P2RAJ7_WEIVI|nr:hypothetical protein [Weissella viridescens]RRG17474.1 hypothetical protein D3P96_07505 [Weissella viridescens]